MSLRESRRSYLRRDGEESSDTKVDRVEDEEAWNASDKSKYRSTKPRKQSNAEEAEERNNSERRKNSMDRTVSRKRSGGSSRVGSGDEDDSDTRKELPSKQARKSQEEKIENKFSSGYQERETEINQKGRDVHGSKGKGIADESERALSRKSGSKLPVHESTQSKSRSKVSSSHDIEEENIKDKNSRYADRKGSSMDKGHGSRDTENVKRRRDESDSIRKEEESNYLDKSDYRSGKVSDIKQDSVRERFSDVRNEPVEVKSRVGNLNPDKAIKSSSIEEKRVDGERIKSRGRPEACEKDNRLGSIAMEERSGGLRDDNSGMVGDKPSGFFDDNESIAHKQSTRGRHPDSALGVHDMVDGERIKSRGRPEACEKDNRLGSLAMEERSGGLRDDNSGMVGDKPSGFFDENESIAHKQSTRVRHPDSALGVHDIVESRERFVGKDEDRHARARVRSGKEIRHSRRSWSPERGGRRHPQSGDSESDTERSVSFKGKERDRESYKDDRSKGRDGSWSDRNKDYEGSKDNWKRRHDSNSDKETAYVVVDFDHDIDWDSQRRDRERNDNKLHNHPGYRKIGRTSSGYGSATRSSDMIEIRPNSIEYGRQESGLVFAGRKRGGPQTEYTSAVGDDQWGYPPDDRTEMADIYGHGDDLQERHPDDGSSALDQNSGRNSNDMQGEKGRVQKGAVTSNRSGGGPSSSGGSQPPFGSNQASGNLNRIIPPGVRGSRLGRGGRGWVPGREGQRLNMPMPMVGSPFGPLNMQPGPMQTLGPNLSPGPGPPMGLGAFIPQFPGPNVWPGARGVDVNMLSVPHGLSPVPPGPSPPRFAPNVVTSPNPAMYFNQQGPLRGVPPGIPGHGFNVMGTLGHGFPNDKALVPWSGPRTSGPPGKAPSRGEQNDYSQNFVDTGMRPQNYIRELELTTSVEDHPKLRELIQRKDEIVDYPKLRELIQRKDEIVANSSSPPMYYKCDLREFVLSPDFFGTKFDVILVDPPWEEYVHRAPGVADHMDYWTFEEISNLKIEAIADTPSFIFLWVGDGVGLEQGRQCLRKWGFRRCEDICWVKTNKSNAASGLRHDSHTLFQHSKEHCLMGIKGTVRRSTDGHIIHANIDTDIVIAEEPPYGSTTKPEDLYRIIEHFSLGRRRIELFGEDHNIRSGWLTVGKGLSSSNFNVEAYLRNFCDKDGKVWQGGRNPPPGAAHLVVTTPEIEALRPKSPPPKNQQQQSSVISIPQQQQASSSRRPAANSPQNPAAALGLNQEATSSNPSTPAQWAPPMIDMKAPDTTMNVGMDNKVFDGYGYEPSGG